MKRDIETGRHSLALEDLAYLEGVSKFPARVKCALLPVMAVKKAMEIRN